MERAATLSARFLLVVAAGAVVVYALVKLRLVVLPVIISLLICTLLAPPVRWLTARGWKPLLATGAVMLGTLVLAAALFAVLAPQIAGEVEDMGRAVREGADEVLRWLTSGPLGLSEQQINAFVDRVGERLRENVGSITGGLLTGAIAVAEGIAGTLLTLVLVFFLLKDGPQMRDWFLRHFDGERREHAAEIATRAWNALGGYVRGTAIVATVDAVLIGLLLAILGVPLVIPLAVLTFFGAFFPLVGATVAGAVAALVALVTEGATDALIVAGGILVIQQVEGDVLQPLVVGRAVRLHPVVILLALTAGAILGGIAGAFLAVPVTAVAVSVGAYLRDLQRPPRAAPPATEPARS